MTRFKNDGVCVVIFVGQDSNPVLEAPTGLESCLGSADRIGILSHENCHPCLNQA